jgi:DNA segregation ATPase FtsK/SpoIIIE, S-DNA-T family
MKRPEKNDPSRLRDALATWDPVRREGEPASDELAAVRQRVLAAERAAGRAPARSRPWRPVLATLASAAALIVLVLVRDGGSPVPGVDRQAAGERQAAESGTAGAPAAGMSGREADRRAGGESRPAGASGGGAEAGADGEAPRLAGPASGGAVASRGPDQGPPDGGRPGGGRAASSAASTASASPPAAAAGGAAPPPPAALTPRSIPVSAPPPAAAPPSAIADVAGASSAAGRLPADLSGQASATASAPGEAALATRQVQLIAPGGTRIVWLIAADPNPPTAPNREDT